jgi:hypothetical protein
VATPTQAGVPEVDITHYNGVAGTFASGRPEVNVSHWLGTAAATPTVAGVTEVDVTHWIGTAAATPTTAGVPEVDLTFIAGAAVSASTAQLGVNVVNAAGTAWGSGAITAASIATGAIDADALAADAGTEIGTAVWATATRQLTSAQTFDLTGNITGNISGDLLGNISGAVTGSVGSVAGTIGGFTAGAKAEIQAEAEDAIVAHRLDELLNADSDIDGAAPPTVGSVFHELMSKTAGSFTFDQTTDSNEAIRDRGDAAWITATGFSTLDAAGIRTAVGLASANLDTQLTAIDDYIDTEVGAIQTSLTTIAGYLDTEVAAILEDTGTTLPAQISALNNLSAAQVNAEVDTALADVNLDHLVKIAVDTDFPTTVHLNSVIGHLADNGTAASFDRTTDSLEALQGSSAPTAAAIADAVWDEATSGHTTSGTFGEQAKTDIDAILEDTAAMATTIATAIAGSRVSYVGPVATNGDLTLYQGNDYSGTNALVITVSSWTGPSVNGVAGQFIVSDREDYEAEGTVAVGLLISGADVVLAQSGTTVTATITIDAADLASLDTYPPKDRPTAYYQLRGEYSSGKWVPISDAKFTLVRKKPIA